MKADLPIVYRKSTAYFAAWPCPMSAIRPLLPHPMLVPVPLGLGRGTLIAAIFDHEETSIGAHREVTIGFQCRLRRSGPLPLVPHLAERFFEDVGTWVQLQAVTTESAEEALRSSFGLPAFVADIRIDRDGDRVACEVTDSGGRLLRIEIRRPGRSAPLAFPLRQYSALGEDLLFTEMHVDAVGTAARLNAAATIEVAEHARTHELAAGALARARPVQVRWLDEARTLHDRAAIRYRMSA